MKDIRFAHRRGFMLDGQGVLVDAVRHLGEYLPPAAPPIPSAKPPAKEEYVLPPPDVSLLTHPDHWAVGKEYMGGIHKCTRWFCESHDRQGFWLYATDGSGEWINVSERAIGATFHEIHKEFETGRLYCSWGRVTPYGTQAKE